MAVAMETAVEEVEALVAVAMETAVEEVEAVAEMAVLLLAAGRSQRNRSHKGRNRTRTLRLHRRNRHRCCKSMFRGMRSLTRLVATEEGQSDAGRSHCSRSPGDTNYTQRPHLHHRSLRRSCSCIRENRYDIPNLRGQAVAAAAAEAATSCVVRSLCNQNRGCTWNTLNRPRHRRSRHPKDSCTTSNRQCTCRQL